MRQVLINPEDIDDFNLWLRDHLFVVNPNLINFTPFCKS